MWAAQYLHHTKSRGFLTSGGLGTMGFGYGAAIGAQMALGNDARVIMLTGDGSFHMGFGAKGYRATTPAEFKAAFADAMQQKGPSWIDCRIGKDEKVLPMIPGGGTINDIIME